MDSRFDNLREFCCEREERNEVVTEGEFSVKGGFLKMEH